MSKTMDFSKNPCPDRIVEDAGMGYAMGVLGGSVFHFAKGLYDSPNGHRLAGGATAVRMKSPRLGGRFAVWGGLYSAADCGLVYARGKEDPWNAIAAGAAAGGLLSLRRGLLVAGRSALAGGALLALIEGSNIVLQRFMVTLPPPPMPEGMDVPLQASGQEIPAGFPPAPPPFEVQGELQAPEPSGSTGWFAGLFRRKQQQNNVATKPEVLELELPSMPIPTFDYK